MCKVRTLFSYVLSVCVCVCVCVCACVCVCVCENIFVKKNKKFKIDLITSFILLLSIDNVFGTFKLPRQILSRLRPDVENYFLFRKKHFLTPDFTRPLYNALIQPQFD